MDTVTWFLILDKAVCISLSANTLGKGMQSIILPPAMGKTGLFNFGMATSLEKGTLNFFLFFKYLRNDIKLHQLMRLHF